jgi:hypothetical protein
LSPRCCRCAALQRVIRTGGACCTMHEAPAAASMSQPLFLSLSAAPVAAPPPPAAAAAAAAAVSSPGVYPWSWYYDSPPGCTAAAPCAPGPPKGTSSRTLIPYTLPVPSSTTVAGTALFTTTANGTLPAPAFTVMVFILDPFGGNPGCPRYGPLYSQQPIPSECWEAVGTGQGEEGGGRQVGGGGDQPIQTRGH